MSFFKKLLQAILSIFGLGEEESKPTSTSTNPRPRHEDDEPRDGEYHK